MQRVEEVARALGLLDLGLDKDVTDLSGGQKNQSADGESSSWRSRISCFWMSLQTIWM
ncbi:MAG: hypothetical protein ACLTLY_07565 [Agathobacter rectalis]